MTKHLYESIKKLSILAEEDLRCSNFKKNQQHWYPELAGAYFLNGETMICNNVWAIILQGEIEGLYMVKSNKPSKDLHKVINEHTITTHKKDIINYKSIKDSRQSSHTLVEINNITYNFKYIKYLYESLDNCVIYQDSKRENSGLYFEGDSGVAFLLPLKKSQKI